MVRHKHPSSLWRALLQLVILAEFLNGGTLCKEDAPQEHLRKSRSIKDAFLKEENYSPARAISEIHNKVANLESSVKNISDQVNSVDTKMERISEQASRFQQSFLRQEQILQQLNGEFATLKEMLSGHGEILGDLEKMASSDDNVFAISNQTCGGVLIGQSGSIHFSSTGLSRLGSSNSRPSTCVWTVRANNRRNVKFQTFATNAHTGLMSSSTGYSPDAYLVEIRSKKSNANDTNGYSAANLQAKLTKLEKNMRYTCNGPVVFVVYVVPTGLIVPSLELHYEGTGKFIKKSILYSHDSLPENRGAFTSDQIMTDDDSLAEHNSTYSMDYTSIFISNYSTTAYLQASIDSETCQDKGTNFVVVTNLLDKNSVAFIDCCQQSCAGNHSLVNYDSPFLVLITRKFQAILKFNMSWEAEPQYPSSSGSTELSSYSSLNYYKCGDVLGGTSGSIYYKPRANYRNDERCIWTIVPQPRPRTSITIDMGSSGVESAYDHLYMMEFTDVNGTALAGGPRITNLRAYGTYRAYSREVYIVFYTDSTVIGQGFSLSWRAAGDLVRTGKDVKMKFTILKTEVGRMGSLMERPPLARNMYQVFMIMPLVASSSSYGMQLSINQTQPTTSGLTGGGDCLNQDVTVYNTYNGVFRKANINRSCNESTTSRSQVKAEIPDGIAMIILNDTRTLDTPPVAINFTWQEEYGQVDGDYVTVENDQCGGVIKGDRGVLKYKVSETYFNNERCVWLLQTPNHTSITLELLKEGFEPCCDKILVNTINSNNGTLSNVTTAIDRDNSTRTFNDSVLVIVFRSDGSSRGRGFALQFSGKGNAPETPEYTYQLRHHNELVGSVGYPDDSEWEEPVPGTKEILVTALSYKITSDEDFLALSTNITFTGGVFRREHDGRDEDEGTCTYESLSFYTSPSRVGWFAQTRFPLEKDVQSCPEKVVDRKSTHVFTTTYAVFLAVYRRLPSNEDELHSSGSGDGDIGSGLEREESGFAFNFRKSTGCGGIYIGDRGVISYKEDGTYLNHERCVWLVQAPQAKRIEFNLEKSGFERDCDFVYVSSISKSGAPGPSTIMQAGNTSTAVVDGPVAIVVFASDHSVNGYGFRLTYSTTVNDTEPFPYIIQLDHRENRTENQFSFQVEENTMVVAAFSVDPDPNSSAKTQVNVTALRPQLDQACSLDKLTFYNIKGDRVGLVSFKSFSLDDVVKGDVTLARIRNETSAEQCSPLGNGDLGNCTNSISDCPNTPYGNLVYVNGTSFVAVYKSGNVSSGDLEYRGFAMTSQPTTTLSPLRIYG